MCGIAGLVRFGVDGAGAGTVVDAMVDTLSSRGPDGGGTWAFDYGALGHRRLAVIDPPGGTQPMRAETGDGPVVIVYSGEVYNFTELRDELTGQGHRFSTSSDTEVVLRGYLEWGDGLPTRLNGMFAAALWDSRRRRLVLLRDRLGIKPLYYYPVERGLLFASEPKAILAHPDVEPVVDLDGLRTALAYVLTIPGVPWAGMREVEPGTIVTLDESGIRTDVYWRLTARPHLDDRPATVAHVRDLLEDVVRRQVVADVPLGVLLSGGLDSSTLAALATAARGEAMMTYDVGLAEYDEVFVPDEERAAPDAPYVAEMVAFLRSQHRTIDLDHLALADRSARTSAVRAYDQPPGSGDRDRSLHLLFRAVRETSTVALSGESADELFGGYALFHDTEIQHAKDFPWVAAYADTYGIARAALRPELDTALQLRAYLADEYSSAVAEVEHTDNETEGERRMRILGHVHLTRSLRVLLDRKDRLSMAAGLEVRVPYCDHRLVEYVYNVPWTMKSFDGREKSLLRNAARDLLPASVAIRRKTAYPSTRHPGYLAATLRQGSGLAADANNPVFAVVDRPWLKHITGRDPRELSAQERNSLEWVMNLDAWLEVYQPTLRLT